MKTLHFWKTELYKFQWLPVKLQVGTSAPFWLWLWFGFRKGRYNEQKMKWEK